MEFCQTDEMRWKPFATARSLCYTMQMQKIWKKLLLVLLALVLLGTGAAFLVWEGYVHPNGWLAARYPVRGVDVSSWQGEIDWPVLAAQDIDFAFLKATEGSGTVDTRFAENWQAARQTSLLVGAYHFFSFDSAGATQGENFMATVPVEVGTLPPVVDVEFYGDHAANPPAREAVNPELRDLLDVLEKAYGQKPILYATGEAYDLYLRTGYEAYPLWVRGVLLPPEEGWTFWQYSNRGRMRGFQGKERFIDLNVFAGDVEELAALCRLQE